MATTVWLDEATRDRLVELKAHYGVTSIGAVIRKLSERPGATATQLYDAHRKEVDAICKRHGIRRLIAFGSRARGDAAVDSDLDLVATMHPGPWLGKLGRVQAELEQALGCPIDLIEMPTHRPRMMHAIKRDGVVLVE